MKLLILSDPKATRPGLRALSGTSLRVPQMLDHRKPARRDPPPALLQKTPPLNPNGTGL